MRAGWVGLGKLGLPCALALSVAGGHEVAGYDISEFPAKVLRGEAEPHREAGLEPLLTAARKGDAFFRLAGSAGELAGWADIIIIAVQTPHPPDSDGTQSFPDDPQDFDYSFLKAAVAEVAAAGRAVPVAVLSTVLPGTMERDILPLAGFCPVAYSPAFISLGTTVAGFTSPDFHLIGSNSRAAAEALRDLYKFTGRPVFQVSPASAELIKMACNMRDSLLITYVNFLAELAQGTGASIEQVTAGLRAHKPGWSPDAGMPDGGPCRPRDLIAMSHLAARAGASADMPKAVALMRQEHAARIARVADKVSGTLDLPVVLAGTAYKPETDLRDGAPTQLVSRFLTGRWTAWDVPAQPPPEGPAVFVICTRYKELAAHRYPPGSVVIDPWGITVPGQPDVQVLRIGR